MKTLVILLLLTAGLSAPFTAGADQASKQSDIKALERQYQKDPNNLSLMLTLGEAYFEAGDFLSSRQLLSKAAAVDSTNAQIFALLARTYITEAQKGYSEKIREDTDYQTRLIFHIFENMNRAIALAPENPQFRMLRGAYLVNMPVFAGFYERMDGTRDVAATITGEMVEKDYTGFVGQAIDDLKVIVRGDAPAEMKAEAYYYLGMAHRLLGLQYWQTLTKEYRRSDAAKRAWADMAPLVIGHEPEEITGERVLIRFNIAFQSDLPPQTAVWIEDAGGNFVKTLYVSGFSGNVKEKQIVLPAWAGSSKFQENNTTGASISYGLHRFGWDCTNSSGERVVNATYTVKAEVHHWPSMHYQIVSADIKVGGEAETKVVEEGDLIPFFEVRYLPE
jgi:hypothetical protein